jgi:hypothetical protein
MLSTPFEFQIVLTPKPMHHTESTALVLSPQKVSPDSSDIIYARSRRTRVPALQSLHAVSRR